MDFELLQELKEEIRQKVIDAEGETAWHKLLANNMEKLIVFKETIHAKDQKHFREEILNAIIYADFLYDDEKLLNIAVMDSAIDVFEY